MTETHTHTQTCPGDREEGGRNSERRSSRNERRNMETQVVMGEVGDVRGVEGRRRESLVRWRQESSRQWAGDM